MTSLMPTEARVGRDGRMASAASSTWLTTLGFKRQVTWRNLTAFLVHCSASILFLVFLNVSQPFLIHQLESNAKHGKDLPSRAGSLSGSLIFYDELLSTFVSLIWGALAEIVGLAAVTSTSYLFIAIGLVSYTIPRKPWPDLIPARLVFAIGGSGATAMLSGIISEFSGSQGGGSAVMETNASLQSSGNMDSETTSHGTLPPPTRQADANGDAEEVDRLLPSGHSGANLASGVGRKYLQRRRHGRVAAVAGVFTGLGSLIAVFVLVRLPQKLADYLEDYDPSTTSTPTHEHKDGPPTDLDLRRATVATFLLVAALALLVAATTALGLKQTQPTRQRLGAADALERRNQQRQEDYGALRDSMIGLADDTRQARRARLRYRLERQSQANWTNVIRAHVLRFMIASIGGFRMVAPVRSGGAASEDTEWLKTRHRLALELRMAYLGGALARAFTIGTTAFLPLLVTHHYYTSRLCRQLPSPKPEAPLPKDELKKLCRSAFTATAILGGTAQLTALLSSPLIGLLCDRLSPTTTISFTSALGAVGFYLLGVGTSGFKGDKTTGEQVADPLTRLSIAAAVLVGLGQIGAIVSSLAGCARARGLLAKEEGEEEAVVQPQNGNQGGDASSASASETVVSRRQQRTGSEAKDLAQEAGRGGGAIAGAYTCTGSLSILIISKLGGLLFDIYVPSPFLLIGGFSAFVSLCGLAVMATKRFKAM
ncbi:uncharacterized protein UHOD_00306 [Ustilago sp. UG-2017b]|nr:uncharacterized protein UHOD_00306 [Ustilago sp. UG-2017b]